MGWGGSGLPVCKPAAHTVGQHVGSRQLPPRAGGVCGAQWPGLVGVPSGSVNEGLREKRPEATRPHQTRQPLTLGALWGSRSRGAAGPVFLGVSALVAPPPLTPGPSSWLGSGSSWTTKWIMFWGGSDRQARSALGVRLTGSDAVCAFGPGPRGPTRLLLRHQNNGRG